MDKGTVDLRKNDVSAWHDPRRPSDTVPTNAFDRQVVVVLRHCVFFATLAACACSDSPTGPSGGSGGGNAQRCGLADISTFTTGSMWLRATDTDGLNHQCSLTINGERPMVIRWDGSQGVVVSGPANCDFRVGEVKWRNLNRTACTIEDSVKPVGSNAPPTSYTTSRLAMSTDSLSIALDSDGRFSANSGGRTYGRCNTAGLPC